MVWGRGLVNLASRSSHPAPETDICFGPRVDRDRCPQQLMQLLHVSVTIGAMCKVLAGVGSSPGSVFSAARSCCSPPVSPPSISAMMG